MARLFTKREALAAGVTYETLRWRVDRGVYLRLAPGVYFEADRTPTWFEFELARAMRLGKVVTGELAATLNGIDGFGYGYSDRHDNIPRTDPQDTLIAIAALTTDLVWEQALEWCLRTRSTTIERLETALKTRRRGNKRIRRVLAIRPEGAPPTGSILETYAVQLIRQNPNLPTPQRQVSVRHWFVDLAWPEHGVFLELDGEGHKSQPEYDAVRQTAVSATTGWLVGRYTWSAIVHRPNATLRSIAELFAARSLRNTS
jgi:very-short-patch-repair endonuclease